MNASIDSIFLQLQPQPGMVANKELEDQFSAQHDRVETLFKRQLKIPLFGKSRDFVLSHSLIDRAHSFMEKVFPLSADSKRASCQLVAKEWALNTGKLPLGGLPRNSVVKYWMSQHGISCLPQTNSLIFFL